MFLDEEYRKYLITQKDRWTENIVSEDSKWEFCEDNDFTEISPSKSEIIKEEVYLCETEDLKYIAKKGDFSLHEAAIGLQINSLGMKNFVETLGFNKSVAYFRYIGGIKLTELTYPTVLSLLIQISLSLNEAEEKIGLSHNDLHYGNVIIKKCEREYLKYNLDTKAVYLDNLGYLAVIIDFDRSTTKIFDHREKNLGVGYHGKSTSAVRDMFCLMVSLYSEFPQLIDILNKFFKIKDPDYFIGNYNFFGHRLPLELNFELKPLIKFLINQYGNYDSVREVPLSSIK